MNRQYGGPRIPQRLILIAAAFGAIVAMVLVYRLLTAGLQSYVALIAGGMLLIGNVPELVRSYQRGTQGQALLNTLVGAALVFFFLGTIVLRIVFWPLAIVMFALALPLTLNRAGMMGTYIAGARQLFGQLRALARARSRMT